MKEKKKNYNYKRSTFYFNGKQYSCYGKTQSEAKAKAEIKKRQLENGEVGISSKMAVFRWCETWLKTYKLGTVTDKSYKNYARHVKVITDEIGNVLLKDVRDVHLQKILISRAGYSKSDLSKLRNTMYAAFHRAWLSRLVPYNPALDLTMPRTAQPNKRRSITEHERTMILKTAANHHAGLWVKAMLKTGLRPGEIIALDAVDLKIKGKMINVDKAKESGNNEIKDPKTDAGNREVPIPDDLLNDLAEAIKNKKPYDPVFTQKTNDRRHTESSFYKSWKNFLKTMDIENGATVKNQQIIKSVISSDLIPYYLRHTYCTDLETAGVPINVARYLMGHSDISITARIYTHTTSKVIDDAATKINALHKASNM